MNNNIIGVRTPLRISLFGGGTDFPSYIKETGKGQVLSFGIDKYVYVFLKPRRDSKIRVAYSTLEEVNSASELNHRLCRACLVNNNMENGFEIHSLADVSSQGSGLGSSSAYTVSLLHAIYSYLKSLRTTHYSLAYDACKVEINDLGSPIGFQDQYACAFGHLNHLVFTYSNNNFYTDIIRNSNPIESLPYLESILSLYYTGNTRSADTILKEQNNNIPLNIKYLDKLNSYVDLGINYLSNKDTNSLGFLLDQSWQEKKNLASNISTPEIDSMYSLAKKNGAIGAKIAGGGGGGYLICISTPENKEKLSSAMNSNGYSELPFKIDTSGSKRIL